MICDKKVLTVAILTAVSSIGVHAETINHTINETLLNDWSNGVLSSAYTEIVGADVTYTGTGKEDLVMTQIEGNRGGTVHNEGAIIHGNGHMLTIDKIHNLTIVGLGDKETETTKKWNSAVYTNTSAASGITVNASGDVSVSGASMGVHALAGVINIKAANITVAGGNAVVAQQSGSVRLEASNAISLSGTSTALHAADFAGDDTGVERKVELIAPVVTIESSSENGSAVNADDHGGVLIQADQATLTGVNAINVAEGGNFSFSGLGDKGGSLVANGNIKVDGTMTLNSDTTVTVNGAGNTAKLARLVGNGEGVAANFVFDHLSTDGTPVLEIGENGVSETKADFTASAMGDLSVEEAVRALGNAVEFGKDQSGGEAAGTVTGNAQNFTVTVDEKGGVSVTGSDITKMTNDLAAASLVAWRNEITTLNDRMSTLRTSPSTIGAWARYNGGEYQYDARSMKHQFNTIEVGADAKVSDNWIVGASFAYTKGDGDYEQGETETDTYSGAFYALWTHEKGSFVDFVMKAGRMENDFDFYNLTGGAYDNGTLEHTGFVMGIETGHRFALPMNAFVEPQLQLTYSRLSSVSETTAARHVELDAMDSLVGRVGIMAGIDCPNDRGSAYVKISALRDFRGDIDGTYSSVTGGGAYSLSQELDDNWFEYAVGGNFKLSDNAYLFADVAKSAGGDIDLDWRANVGAKLFF